MKTLYQEILEGEQTYSNDCAGWIAVSIGTCHYIHYYKGRWKFSMNKGVNRFYKNRESWSKRVAQLVKRGY